MTQPSLDRHKLAQLEELVELAKEIEEKLRIYNRESQRIAEKWQDRADKNHKSLNALEDG
ncbi:MAG: hypothetical protein MUD14_23175 [Hydrococcus sp. Prado102]|jgi:hypothetical protein|nr:hypothetical protein [Hydrococcus sp. Prado102]